MDDITADNHQIQLLVSQLYEDERLTAALTDEAATLLLSWGEQQLNNLAQVSLSKEELDQAAHALQRALRLVNRLIEQRAELSDAAMIQQLLKLIDQVIFLTVTVRQGTLQESDHDQAEA